MGEPWRYSPQGLYKCTRVIPLAKIAEYEAVHPVRGLVDFRKRIGPHRRCFYFTHEAMPREPLVMVHVALMDEIGSSVQVGSLLAVSLNLV